MPAPNARVSAPRISLDAGALRFVAAFAPGAPVLLRASSLADFLVTRAGGALQHATVDKAVRALLGAFSDEAQREPEDAPLTETEAVMACGALGANLPRGATQDMQAAFVAAREALAHAWAEAAKALPKQVVLPLAPKAALEVPPPPPGLTAKQLAQRADILATLETVRWNRGRAAEALGIPRRTLYRRFEELGIPTRNDEGAEEEVDAAPPVPTAKPLRAPAAPPPAAPKGKAKARR